MTYSVMDDLRYQSAGRRDAQEQLAAIAKSTHREHRRSILDVFRHRPRGPTLGSALDESSAAETPEMLIYEAVVAKEIAETTSLIEQHERAVRESTSEPPSQVSQDMSPEVGAEESEMNAHIEDELEDQVAEHFKESLVAMINDSVVMMENMVSDSKSTIITLKEHRTLVIGQSDAHLATIDENRELANKQVDNEIANAEAQIEALKQHIARLQETRRDQNVDFDNLKNRAQSKRHDDLELVDRMIIAEESKLDALVTPKSGSTEIDHQKQARQPGRVKPALVKSEQVEVHSTMGQRETAFVAG